MTPEADISRIGSIEVIDTHTVVRLPSGDRVKVWFNGSQQKWGCTHWQNETYVGIGSSAYEAYTAYILLCKLTASRETNHNMVWIQNYSCPPCCHNHGKFQVVQTSDTQTQFCVYCGKQLRFDSTQQVMYKGE